MTWLYLTFIIPQKIIQKGSQWNYHAFLYNPGQSSTMRSAIPSSCMLKPVSTPKAARRGSLSNLSRISFWYLTTWGEDARTKELGLSQWDGSQKDADFMDSNLKFLHDMMIWWLVYNIWFNMMRNMIRNMISNMIRNMIQYVFEMVYT